MINQVKLLQLAAILLVFYGMTVQKAQGQEEDMNIWSRFAVKYDLSSKTRIAIEEEFRFFENASRLEQNHTEIGLTHELSPRWDGGIYYRFIYETDDSRGYSLGHRGWLQLEYKLLDTDFKVSLRSRLQTSYTDFYTRENGGIPKIYNRNKLNFSYKPKKANWIPHAGIELWYYLNPKSGNQLIDKYRTTLGLEYRQSSHLRWELFCSFQQQVQVADPGTSYIMGLSATYLIN
ncbi:MAG: DUF2490 domain-containing protein [Bacteroidales bacterium]|nr:DUF2490 domain-containing protein [Bacteroidales bacterium]